MELKSVYVKHTFTFQVIHQMNRLSESQEKAVNLKKDLAEMREWMTQAEEEYLERDFEYKSPEELESALEEMKVRKRWMTFLFKEIPKMFMKWTVNVKKLDSAVFLSSYLYLVVNLYRVGLDLI